MNEHKGNSMQTTIKICDLHLPAASSPEAVKRKAGRQV